MKRLQYYSTDMITIVPMGPSKNFSHFFRANKERPNIVVGVVQALSWDD